MGVFSCCFCGGGGLWRERDMDMRHEQDAGRACMCGGEGCR